MPNLQPSEGRKGSRVSVQERAGWSGVVVELKVWHNIRRIGDFELHHASELIGR